MQPKVSVVMSNYNGVTLKLLEGSLSSILKNNYKNLEVILVDNASTDNSIDFVKKKFGKNLRLTIVQNPVNMYSQGLNLGIQNSTGKYIAFFNNDARVENGYFQDFVKFLEKDKSIALAQGKLLSSKNNKLIDCAGETMDIYGNPISMGNGEIEKGNYIIENELLSVTGSCSILRYDVLKKIGFFDEEYGIGYEDMDLALRARERGYRIVYYPKVRVFHQRGATDLAPMIKQKVRFHFNKNRIATIIKHYPLPLMIKSLVGVFVIYFAMGFLEIIYQKKLRLGMTRFAAILWVLVNMPKILNKRKLIQKKINKKHQDKMFSLFSSRTFLQSIMHVIKK